MCDLPRQQSNLVVLLADRLHMLTVEPTLYDYAALVLATGTPFDRARTYLQDTGSPESATGRLLLRAAEKSLRKAGDIEGDQV